MDSKIFQIDNIFSVELIALEKQFNPDDDKNYGLMIEKLLSVDIIKGEFYGSIHYENHFFEFNNDFYTPYGKI